MPMYCTWMGTGSGLVPFRFAYVSYMCRTYFVHVSYMSRSYKGTEHVRHRLQTLMSKYRNMGEADPNLTRIRDRSNKVIG
jgi:hypothetical protein